MSARLKKAGWEPRIVSPPEPSKPTVPDPSSFVEAAQRYAERVWGPGERIRQIIVACASGHRLTIDAPVEE